MYDLLMSDIKQAMRYELQAISCKAEKKHLPTFHFFTVTFHDSRFTIDDSRYHSVLKLFTGLVNAALTA